MQNGVGHIMAAGRGVEFLQHTTSFEEEDPSPQCVVIGICSTFSHTRLTSPSMSSSIACSAASLKATEP